MGREDENLQVQLLAQLPPAAEHWFDENPQRNRAHGTSIKQWLPIRFWETFLMTGG